MYRRILFLTLAVVFCFSNTPTINAQKLRRMIVKNSFTISPGQFVYFPFIITRGEQTASVAGQFRASEGSHNVEVFIVDQDGFDNFKSGNQAQTYYNSGRVIVGTINVRLAPGVYYLIFSNTYSIISNKAVSANIGIFD